MGTNNSNIKIKRKKTCIRVIAELECNKLLYSLFFLKGEEKDMYIVTIIIVAMISSVLTLALHCCVIVGKESDEIWEDEQITKKENKGE